MTSCRLRRRCDPPEFQARSFPTLQTRHSGETIKKLLLSHSTGNAVHSSWFSYASQAVNSASWMSAASRTATWARSDSLDLTTIALRLCLSSGYPATTGYSRSSFAPERGTQASVTLHPSLYSLDRTELLYGDESCTIAHDVA